MDTDISTLKKTIKFQEELNEEKDKLILEYKDLIKIKNLQIEIAKRYTEKVEDIFKKFAGMDIEEFSEIFDIDKKYCIDIIVNNWQKIIDDEKDDY